MILHGLDELSTGINAIQVTSVNTAHANTFIHYGDISLRWKLDVNCMQSYFNLIII